MKMKKRNITILSFGDRRDHDEYRKFDREEKSFLSKGFDYATANYKNLLEGKVPKVNTKKLIILLPVLLP